MDRRAFLAVLALSPISPARAARPTLAQKLVAAARSQIGWTVTYDPAYRTLSYPNGDVPPERGVCTDVVIRAYRSALSVDLQRLVHEDMRRNFSAYPRHWGLKRPDRNIDHRRVANLQVFLTRRKANLALSDDLKTVRPGDLVTMMLPGNLPHIVIAGDKMNEDNTRPLVIHNIGRGAQEEDVLSQFKLTGHYRFLPGA